MMQTQNMSRDTGLIVIGVIGNVLATVGVVLVNKLLFSVYNFKFMLLLSSFHFVATMSGLHLLRQLGFFTHKPAPFWGIFPLAMSSLGSVAFMNLNLAFNSVGFYQISKLLCIPVTLILQYLFFGQTASRSIQFSLIIILCGVGVATFSDVELNFLGSVFAAFAVLFTTLGQIFTNSKPKELGLDSMQLLYHATPIMTVGMVSMIPFGLVLPGFDPIIGPGSLSEFEWSLPVIGWILVTCVFAFGVNVTNYYVIGKTSPVTYQVVGHLKTCLILVLGFFIFKYPIIWRNVIGISIAVVGMIVYTELKRTETSSAKKPSKV